jgi:hypothetical protein
MSSSNGHAVVADPLVGSSLELSHRFVPRDPAQPWGLCQICGYAESAHVAVVSPYVVLGLYRCPDCVEQDKSTCSHS